MTSKEWAEKTVRDIAKKRILREEGKKQAITYGICNREKVQRRLK